MRRHIIPQEFNQQDKIGKLTMPQAAVLTVGTFLFVLIVITANFWVSALAFFPIAIVTFIFMFFRVNKMPLYEFLMVYLVYSGTPKLLIYRSDNLKSSDEEEDELVFEELVKVKKEEPVKRPQVRQKVANQNEKRKKAIQKNTSVPRQRPRDNNKGPQKPKNTKIVPKKPLKGGKLR